MAAGCGGARRAARQGGRRSAPLVKWVKCHAFKLARSWLKKRVEGGGVGF